MPALRRHAETYAVTEVADPGRCADLLAHLGGVPDPRKPRGVRHPLCALLAVAAAAVLSGARSFTALGVRAHPRTGAYRPPHESTVRRGLQLVDPDAVDDALAAWLSSRRPAADN